MTPSSSAPQANISRRLVIGAAAGSLSPIGQPMSSGPSLPHLCARWRALDAEIGRLTEEWGRLEAWLCQSHAWLRLSPEARNALSEGDRLGQVEVIVDVEPSTTMRRGERKKRRKALSTSEAKAKRDAKYAARKVR